MGLFRICNKLRYPFSLNPTFFSSKTLSSSTIPIIPPSDPSISSSGYPSFSGLITSTPSKSHLSSISPSGCFSSYVSNICFFKSISTLRNKGVKNGDAEQCGFAMSSVDINSIIDVIKSEESDLETRLDALGSNLSRWVVVDILRALNVTEVPAMRFFEWIRVAHPNLARNADICSLMIDNCGRLGDYGTMLRLLKDYCAGRICLSDQAFGFLPILSSSKEVAKKSIRGVVTVLDEVGGSCRNSGIHSLLELLCSMNSFELANFVVEIAERRVSYYNILVRHICVGGRFDDARRLLEEMWQFKCDPDAKTYNLLISSLCKQGRIDEGFSVVEEMLTRGCDPDEITFEILIYFACRHGRSDQAVQLYNQMVSRGIKPRLPTHYAFVRGYFNSQQFDEAYRYVVDTSAEHPWSAEGIYNVLAGLHEKHGDLLVAYNLLIEMIQKGIKPKYSLYVRVCKRLCKTGKEKFATNLKTRFSSSMLKFKENTR